jgi:outer membrane protein assembly factor BamE (lipoprotein component of BamABCDE complex)
MKWTIRFLLLGIGIGFVVFFLFSHAVNVDKFKQISVGMTKAQVQQLIGAPEDIRHYDSNSITFFYGGFSQLKWCSMEITFRTNDHVVSKFHDH